MVTYRQWHLESSSCSFPELLFSGGLEDCSRKEKGLKSACKILLLVMEALEGPTYPLKLISDTMTNYLLLTVLEFNHGLLCCPNLACSANPS